MKPIPKNYPDYLTIYSDEIPTVIKALKLLKKQDIPQSQKQKIESIIYNLSEQLKASNKRRTWAKPIPD